MKSNMPKLCIDYRNGPMGLTVLSHILFSTNQIDTDLNLFFSETGDAHSIKKLNRTNLTAQHLIEHPSADHDYVLKIVCSGWDQILRLKMAYHKWMKKTPNMRLNILIMWK